MAHVTFEGVRLELEVAPCAACGRSDFRDFWRRMRHGLDLETKVCTHCGLFQTNPRPTPDANARFYETLYPKFHDEKGIDDVAWLEKSDRLGDARVSLLAEHVPVEERAIVFEVGAGAGGFLSAAARRTNWIVSGIEPGEAQAEVCKARGFDVRRAFWEGTDLLPESQRAIVAFHAFEHLLDPRRFLRWVRAALAPDGLLYLEVPNLSHPGDLNEFFQFPHVYAFTAITLRSILGVEGFRVIYTAERLRNLSVVAVKGEPAPIERYDVDSFLGHLAAIQRVQKLARLIPPVGPLQKVRSTLEYI